MGQVIIGVGNAWRGDDGVGPEVARRLEARQLPGLRVTVAADPTCLWEAWAAGDDVVIVDAQHSGAPAGTVLRYDATRDPLPADGSTASTHGLGVAHAVSLARALGRMPRTLTVVGIEGSTFDAGSGLSPEVERAAAALAAAWPGLPFATERGGATHA